MSVNYAPRPEAEVHRRDVIADILPIRQHRPEATVTSGIRRTAVHHAAARRLPKNTSALPCSVTDTEYSRTRTRESTHDRRHR